MLTSFAWCVELWNIDLYTDIYGGKLNKLVRIFALVGEIYCCEWWSIYALVAIGLRHCSHYGFLVLRIAMLTIQLIVALLSVVYCGVSMK